MYSDFYKLFQGVYQIDDWTISELSAHFQLPAEYFTEAAPGIITIDQKSNKLPHSYNLPGSIFFVTERVAVRGMPKILFGSIYQPEDTVGSLAEPELRSGLAHQPVIFEEKINGVNIRLFKVGGNYFFASRHQYNGLRGLGEHDIGQIAREVVEKHYPGAFALVDAGFHPVFELLAPEFDFLSVPPRTTDLILIDLMENHRFVAREQKAALAEQYQLKIPKLVSTLEKPLTERQFLKQIKRLEYLCHQLKIEGVVAKSHQPDSDQVFLKIKAQSIQTEHWGTPAIPKRFILEVIRGLKSELPPEKFLDAEFALRLIKDELSDEFIINQENQAKIRQYYDEEAREMTARFTAFQRAEVLWRENKFQSRREIALAAKAEPPLVRFYLFQFWKENQN